MGVDLTFLVSLSQGTHIAHTMLVVGSDKELNAYIQDLCKQKGIVAPKPISCYVAIALNGEPCYGTITYDKYGDKMYYLYAKDLKKFKLGEDCSDAARAAFEYIKCLSDSLEIYLYWH